MIGAEAANAIVEVRNNTSTLRTPGLQGEPERNPNQIELGA